jgi:hypothetical protein
MPYQRYCQDLTPNDYTYTLTQNDHNFAAENAISPEIFANTIVMIETSFKFDPPTSAEDL